MHAATPLVLDLPKLGPHAIAPGFALEQECSAPALAAGEREPQESKGLRFAEPAPLAPHRCLAAELQQAGLFPVKLAPELLEPRSQRIPAAPCISFMLEAYNAIVGRSHNDPVAGGFSPAPWVDPQRRWPAAV